MLGFRVLALAMLLALVGFTAYVISNHGINLLPVFFGDMAAGGWPGQFNADFLTFLVLSGLWTAWRNSFSGSGLLLGILAFNLGGVFLLSYVIYLSWKCQGDWAKVLLGNHYRGGI